MTDIWQWRADRRLIGPMIHEFERPAAFYELDVNWPEIIQMKGFYSFSLRAHCIKPSTLCDGYINLLLFSSALNVPQTHHRESHEQPSHIEIADGIFPSVGIFPWQMEFRFKYDWLADQWVKYVTQYLIRSPDLYNHLWFSERFNVQRMISVIEQVSQDSGGREKNTGNDNELDKSLAAISVSGSPYCFHSIL